MKKTPNSNSNPRLCPNPNPNPNHNPYPNVRGGYDTNHRDQKVDASVAAGPALSEDSSSFNWKPISRDVQFGGASASYVSFNISTLSKKDLRDLKRRLVSELEQVRNVTSRIESRELQSSARSVGCSASGIYCSSREVSSPAALQQNHLSQPEPFSEKEIRVSEAKNEHLPPLPNQEMFGLGMTSSPRAVMDSKNLLSGIMKRCSQILARLMKHKGGMWFNSPVDVQGMGLHDYRLIIKHPMDLGTVRSKLKNGVYKKPVDFAEDIRLTFNNALIYNPEAHEVHKLAALLLRQFEGLFGPAYAKYEKQLVCIARQVEEKQQMCSSWPHPVSENSMRADMKPVLSALAPVSAPAPAPVPHQRLHSNQIDPPSMPSPHHQQPQQQYPITARTIGIKLPKPKAKDPNKRPMSYEERQKLSFGLQSLPEEKMNHVLQIVKKRNVDTQQDGDEIVLDFETMDAETLWELDRFVYNCKKTLSKIKRQEALAGNVVSSAPTSSTAEPSLPADANHKSPNADDTTAKRGRKGDPVDEEIDIGEEMTSTNYPSVEIEKDDGHASSSSSSGSDSSSSSDSDSGSSSGSDSDDEDGRSPVKRSGSPPS